MAQHQHDKVRSRNEAFVAKTATKISKEVPSVNNPYIAEKMLCYGYDVTELMRECSYAEVFYLMFKGELPDKGQVKLLQQLMVALINPGPRHPATRAAMNVGVGKTNPAHILPIASSLLSGEFQGGADIEACMRFLRKHHKTSPQEVIEKLPAEQNSVMVPGFGSLYGGIDERAGSYAQLLTEIAEENSLLHWGCELANALQPHNMGWLMPGVAAAVFAELGFQPRAGICLFQLMCAPGLVAHGLELANKPITAMPYVSDENYVIETR